MKKILMLLLVCTMIFSLTLTMTSCDFFKNIFGGEEQPDEPDTPDDPNNPGIDSGDPDIIDGITNVGNGGIELPITNVNSQDMTQPEVDEGAEEGTEETPDAE